MNIVNSVAKPATFHQNRPLPTAEFRVPIGSAPLHAIVHVKSQPEAGMYTVQVFSVTRTFHIYDELALAALVTEAASQVRKGLLESAFGLS